MKIALAQIAPVFLDRDATTKRVVQSVADAARQGAELIAFGESLIPAYPLWLARTDAARFNAADQKELHALYLQAAVCIEDGHLDPIRESARANRIAVIVGFAERPTDRGGHSLFCSRAVIDATGSVLSVHRKLSPTYEERLSWAMGDGAGLATHRIGPFTVGALNCWENWMPLARAALYAAGENLHVMLWPGSSGLTRDITRFVALESRSYVASVGVVVRESDLPMGIPHRDRMVNAGEVLYDGGSCLCGPDGHWIIAPVSTREELLLAELDLAAVFRERQNLDPAGHYARPDVLQLHVDRARQSAARFQGCVTV